MWMDGWMDGYLYRVLKKYLYVIFFSDVQVMTR